VPLTIGTTMSDPDWIEHMHMKKGALHRELHVAAGQKIPQRKIAKAAKSSNPTERRRAILAEKLRGFSK
jgi:hypothetical protein